MQKGLFTPSIIYKVQAYLGHDFKLIMTEVQDPIYVVETSGREDYEPLWQAKQNNYLGYN